MRSSTIDERFAAFVEEPSSERFLFVREQIIGDPLYDPYSDALRRLELFHEDGDFDVVVEEAAALEPLWRLSPRLHYLVGTAALEMGELAKAEVRRHYSRACLDALLELGDGTPEAPFLVTYLSDEYDLLRYFDAQMQHQQVVELDGALFDVLTTDDDVFWFDATDLVAAAGRAPVSEVERRRSIARPV